MRSFKELLAALDLGKRPCGFPNCQGYGDIITRQHGIVCHLHASTEASDIHQDGQYLVPAARAANSSVA